MRRSMWFMMFVPMTALAGPLSGFTTQGEMGSSSTDVTGLQDLGWSYSFTSTDVIGPGLENPLIMPWVYGDFSDTAWELTIAVNTAWSAAAFNGLRFTLTDPGAPTLAPARLLYTDIPDFGPERLFSARSRVAFNFQGMSSVGNATVGFNLPEFEVTGACPGRASVFLAGFTPGGRVALVRGVDTGMTATPGGPCAGTLLGIDRPSLITTLGADARGEISLNTALPAGVCGSYVEAIDLTTCAVSGVIALP